MERDKRWPTDAEVAQLIHDRGEWIYELYAVLIHSGTSSHYLSISNVLFSDMYYLSIVNMPSSDMSSSMYRFIYNMYT